MEVSGDALQAALARAITDAISPERQKEIFERALYEYLFKKDRDGKSAITESFERALRDATGLLAAQVVNQPENRARIVASIQEAFDKLIADGGLAASIQKKLTPAYGW